MNLGQFIDTFKEAIARRVVESFPPLYRPSENGGKMPRLLRKPLGAQADAIRGAALSLEAHRGTTVVGEMGTGKTFIVQVPPLSEDKLYPKEKALVDLVAAERMEGRRVLVYATHTGDQGHHREDGRHPHPPRVPGGGDEGRRGGPRTAGGVGGGQGERGHRRDDLPPQAGADRPRPHRLPDPLLVRDRLLGLRDAAGVAAVVAHRARPAR